MKQKGFLSHCQPQRLVWDCELGRGKETGRKRMTPKLWWLMGRGKKRQTHSRSPPQRWLQVSEFETRKILPWLAEASVCH